jgi:hypothetical protein
MLTFFGVGGTIYHDFGPYNGALIDIASSAGQMTLALAYFGRCIDHGEALVLLDF